MPDTQPDQKIELRPLARILIDESHRQAWSTRGAVAAQMNAGHTDDSSYEQAAIATRAAGYELVVHIEGEITQELLASYDLLIIPHASNDEWEKTTQTGSPMLTTNEIDSIQSFVIGGGSLIVLAETEQPKYGNNFSTLTERFGISIVNTTVTDPTHSYKDVPTWVLAELLPTKTSNLNASVTSACFYRAGALAAQDEKGVEVIARSSVNSSPPSAALMMTTAPGDGRVVVVADSDLFGDDSIDDLDHKQLWLNLVAWAAGARASKNAHNAPCLTWAHDDSDWLTLAASVETLRTFQAKDGSIDTTLHSAPEATALIQTILTSINALAPRFAHQSDYFAQLAVDMNNWVAGRFGVPDYLDALALFRPELHRRNGVEHLAVFSMYTQNGLPNRNIEAVITKTFWPDWLADQEKTYNNPAFIPIEFVAFTKGYDTHCATLFPETVATRTGTIFYWGGIFCDREAARFRLVSNAAVDTLKLTVPPQAQLLLDDQQLAKETFVLWDLIHDRTHSHGDLPFDPFMIKQRMPFHMYALEELRCDLNTFKESLDLDERGIFLGPYIRYAILFDRLFRFPITGARVRNYDGLGGQMVFAWLHKNGVLRWHDNALTLKWEEVNQSIVDLRNEVENLYRSGIDRSRFAQWLASYEFVRDLVQPHPASTWAKGPTALPLTGELGESVDLFLPDEFPLNVFYDALSRKLAPVIESAKGVTG